MKKIQEVGVELRHYSRAEADAAAEAAGCVIRAVGATKLVYVLADGPVKTHRVPSPAPGDNHFTVSAEFAVAEVPGGMTPHLIAVERWPVVDGTSLPQADVRHVMIDLETLGRRPGCPVLSLGAVEFGPDGTGRTFYIGLDEVYQIEAGLHPDRDTVAWWAAQNGEARAAIEARARTDPSIALLEFTKWLESLGGDPKQVRVWGNGADFDQPILAAVHEMFFVALPWQFWNSRCYRTLKSLRKDIKFAKPTIEHHALEDARAQASHAVTILNELDLWSSV